MGLSKDSSKSSYTPNRMNENSLKNLKLGVLARKKGKVKLNLTVIPEVPCTQSEVIVKPCWRLKYQHYYQYD